MLRLAEALGEGGHETVLFGSREWPEGVWKGEFVRIAGDGPGDFADGLRKARPRERCDVLYSLERVWECDAYRAGDGVHRAWLERRAALEPGWRGWWRGMQGKHREILKLEEAVFAAEGERVIIANSRMVAEEIGRYFRVPEERVRVIYNGLPAGMHEGGEELRAETRARLGLAEGECAVLFAGSGWERKGLRYAMEGINRTRGATLLVAGTGKRNGLPASAMTRFLGTVHAMRELTEAADIFLLPTIYDPFSNASLEAMAAGLPVITTEGNGFAEVMRTGMDGEVLRSAADIAGIAGGIDKWRGRETPETRAYRRAEARRYTMERNAQETLEALARISAR